MSPLDAALEEFIDYRKRLGLLRDPRGDYRARFHRLLLIVGDQPPAALTKVTIREWQSTINTLRPDTIKKYTTSVRHFCAWLVQTGRLDVNPLAKPPTRAERLRALRPPGKRDLAESSTVAAAMAYVNGRVRRGEIMPTTAKNTRALLGFFAETIGNPDAGRITRRHVLKWMEVPGSAASRRQRFSAARTFVRWLVDEGALTSDPFARIRAPREPRRVPRGLARSDVLKALDASRTDSRMTLVLLLMVQEGLRCVEVCRLERGDIDTNERTMLVRGKGGHQRLLPFSDETWTALALYLKEMPGGTGPLLRSRIDVQRGLTPGYLSVIVSQLMAAVGIKAAALDGRSAHAWRHTFATDALRNGAHLRDLQAALGHVSLQTTEINLSTEVRGLREAMGGRTYTTAAS